MWQDLFIIIRRPVAERLDQAFFPISFFPTPHNPFSFRSLDFLWFLALCPYLPLFPIPTIPQPLAIDFRLVFIIYYRVLSPVFGVSGIGHWILGPWPLDFGLFCIAYRAPKPIYSFIRRTSSWIVGRWKGLFLETCCAFGRRLAIQSHQKSPNINREMPNSRK